MAKNSSTGILNRFATANMLKSKLRNNTVGGGEIPGVSVLLTTFGDQWLRRNQNKLWYYFKNMVVRKPPYFHIWAPSRNKFYLVPDSVPANIADDDFHSINNLLVLPIQELPFLKPHCWRLWATLADKGDIDATQFQELSPAEIKLWGERYRLWRRISLKQR